ncbi:unnamed protein product [Psylliodes chrysocephalus]|uniref:Uncharacterized protein n=1 Tax=Psylliodes chrysocephalus TaxID=3402493 RepID=A0A9P0GN00_9CUCU|nr:unnamed protein product [Psylliodes chrysocephala]
MPNTRKNIECEVFGAPTELKCNILPTYGDVMRAYLQYRQIGKDDNNGKDPSVSEVSKKVISALKTISENASLQVCKYFDSCKCKIKVLKTEHVDVKLTKVLEKRMQRKIKSIKQLGNQSDPEKSELVGKVTVLDATSSQMVHQLQKQDKRKLRGVDFRNLAEACDRTEVSDRCASFLANADLQNLGVVSRNDPSKLLNRSKLRRERKRRSSEIKKESTRNLEITGLYFDSRKDRTLLTEKKGSTYHKRYVLEEHIVLIAEPGSIYLGHVTPNSGNAKDITSSIMNCLRVNLGPVDEISAVGCDGTVVNTGFKNGVVKQLEKAIGYSSQWLICLLHANELPL